MSQHCPGCPYYLKSRPADAVGDVRAFTISPCPGCGHEAQLATLWAERDGFALSAQRTATDLHDAGKRIMELEAALTVADEMADEILMEQSPGSILGKIAVRFHEGRE